MKSTSVPYILKILRIIWPNEIFFFLYFMNRDSTAYYIYCVAFVFSPILLNSFTLSTTKVPHYKLKFFKASKFDEIVRNWRNWLKTDS